MAYYAKDAVSRWNSVQDKAANILRASGLTDWSKTQERLRKDTDDLGNYLSGGQYTSADNQRYRDSATKAIADLDEQLKTYKKSSDEYQQLDGYRTYYQRALDEFDRLAPAVTAQEYVTTDSWHDEASYKAQRDALQQSLDAIQSEMDGMEDQTGSDYQRLAGYRDMYKSMLDEGLTQRESRDRMFKDANDYVDFQRSFDYKNTVEAKKNLEAKRAELKQLQDSGAATPMVVGDLSTVDPAAYAREVQLKSEIAQMEDDLSRVEQWQARTVAADYGFKLDPEVNYQQLVDELKEAKQQAKTEEDAAQIDMRLRVLAGENYDGTLANGTFDDSTLLGQYLMATFDTEAAQKRIDEIDKELTDLGVTTKRWAAGFTDESQYTSPAQRAEVEAKREKENQLRAEKTRLQSQMATSQRLQDRNEIASTLPQRADYSELVAEGAKHLTGGDAGYYQRGYDEHNSNGETGIVGTTALKNFYALKDADPEMLEQLGIDPNLRDMMLAAIGAEHLGRDIGFTVQDVYDAYEAQLNTLAGSQWAQKINGIKSGLGRTLAQTGYLLGEGMASFPSNIAGYFTDEYRPASRMEVAAGLVQNDMNERSKLLGYIGQAAQTTGNMLPMIALSYLTSGMAGAAGIAAETAGTIGQAVGATAMGFSSAGSSYQQALAEGWDPEDARVYSTILGAAEGTMQYAIGGVAKLGGVETEQLLTLARGIDRAGARFAAELGIRNLSEAVEEVAQNKLQRYLDYAMFDKGGQYDWLKFTEEDWDTVIVTLMSTTLLEAGHTAKGTFGAKKTGEALSGKVIPSKGFTLRQQARNEDLAKIGEKMKSNDAVTYTLIELGTQMDEGSQSYELAKAMQDHKIPTNAMNLGNLFDAYLSDNAVGKTKAERAKGYNDAMMSIIGGGLKFNQIKSKQAAAEQAEIDHREMVKANPGAEVLDKTASELTALGLPGTQAAKISPIVNKVLSGESLSEAEMTELTGDSFAAKAARAVLSQRNEGIKVDMDPALAKEAILALTDDIKAIKKQQAALTRSSVLQAAMDAVSQFNVRQAVTGENINWDRTKTMDAAAQDLVSEETAAKVAESRQQVEDAKAAVDRIQKMSFREIANLAESEVAEVLGEEAAVELGALTHEMNVLAARVEGLRENKMPTKAQRDEMSKAQARLADIKRQVESVYQKNYEALKARAEEAQKAAAATAQAENAANVAARGNAVIPAKQGVPADVILNPDGGVQMTRQQFVQQQMANGVSEEEANKNFDEASAQSVALYGGKYNGQQSTDQDGQGNDLGGQRDGAEDSVRGDRSEQTSDRGREAGRKPLLTRNGEAAAEVSESATLVDGDHISVLATKYKDLPELTAQLKASGFKKITYVTDGQILTKGKVDGEIKYQSVPAVYRDGELFLRLDYNLDGYNYVATAEHERTHLRVDLLRQWFTKQFGEQVGETETRGFVAATLQSILTEDEYNAAFLKYWEAYAPVYAKPGRDVLTIGHMVNEEMLCDIMGGLNNFGADLSRYKEDAEEVLRETKFDSVTENLVADPEGDPGSLQMEAIDENAMPYEAKVEELVPKNILDPFRNEEIPGIPAESQPTPGEDQMHDGVSRLSITSLAEATGFELVENDEGQPYGLINKATGERVTRVTPAMMRNTPMGKMIQTAVNNKFIGRWAALKEYKMLADMMNMVIQYNDAAVVWELVGSQLFSGIKSNSDTQYNWTIDFGTICRKTQALVNAMSKAMIELGHGLDRREVEALYLEVGKEGEATPCPVCYVFSRWMGIGGLLDQIHTFQNKFFGETNSQGQIVKASEYSEQEIAGYMDLVEEAARTYAEENPKDDFFNKKTGDFQYGKILSAMKSKPNDRIANAIEKINQSRQAQVIISDFEKKMASETGEQRAKSEANIKLFQEYVLSENELSALDEEIAAAQREIEPLEAYQWLARTMMKKGAFVDENGQSFYRWVKNDEYKPVPKEILFDLNRGGEFAKDYPLTWGFRTGKGNAMGKAINPYSDARVGETIQGVAKKNTKVLNKELLEGKDGEALAKLLDDNKILSGEDLNVFLAADKLRRTSSEETAALLLKAKVITAKDYDSFVNGNEKAKQRVIDKVEKKQQELMAKAVENMRKQNLIGGMRFQSTSDFRFEWGSDYLMTFFELQAIGANVQLYTKVLEAVDFLASTGADCNLSVMPYGDGLLRDANGKIIGLKFSPVTGVEGNEAIRKSRQYDNVQLILVGISDEHILTALAGDEVTFVIPFHGSGQSVEQVQALMDLLNENLDLTTAKDYADVQDDHVNPKRTPEQKAMWDLRVDIIQGRAENLTPEQQKLIQKNPHLQKLWNMFYKDTTNRAYHCFLNAEQAGKIFPYEYWDTTTTYANADINGEIFKSYCESMGIIPRFSGINKKGKAVDHGNFAYGGKNGAAVKGYWKLLIDRKMYSNTYETNEKGEKVWTGYGAYRDQQRINVSDVKSGSLNPTEANESVAPEARTKEIHPEKTDRIVERFLDKHRAMVSKGDIYDLTKVSDDFRKAKREAKAVLKEDTTRASVQPGEEEETAPVKQGFTSKGTSINSSKLPVLFTKYPSKVKFVDGGTNIDIGGGKFNNVTQYLDKKYNTQNYVFDPYNRTVEPAKGGLIVARDPKANLPKASWEVEQGSAIRYSLQPGEEEALIIKNDTKRGVDFVEKLLDGTKNGETRDSKSIAPNKWYGVSNGGKNSQVVGRIKFGEPVQISKDPNSEHYDLYVDAAIEGTDYDVKDGQTKWYYPVLEKEDFRDNPKPVLRTWPGHGAYQRENTSRYSLTPAQQKNADFNQKQTEVGSKLKTLNGSPIARYQNNVGKFIDNKIYVHKDYARQVVPNAELDRAEEVLREKFPNFQYNTITYNTKNGNIRFEEAPNFDTAREPIPGGTVTVKPDGSTDVNYVDQIWHHKWQWVDNDYKGFDVAGSWNWSKQWLSALPETSNGSTRGPVGWNQQMDKYGLPKDPASEVEIKDKKAEIARIKGEPVKGTIPAKRDLTKQQDQEYNESRFSRQGSADNGGAENAAGNQPVVHRLAQFLQKNDWARSYLEAARKGSDGVRARDLWRTTERRQREIINGVADYLADNPYIAGKDVNELFDYGVPDFIDYFFEQAAKDPDGLWTWMQTSLRPGTAEELVDIFDKGLKDSKAPKKFRAGYVPTALDKEYLNAIKKNDTATLARMVAERAKAAGYNKEVFQHAKTYFPIFSKGELGFHLGSESQAAEFVQNSRSNINPDLFLHLYANIKSPYVLPKDVTTTTFKKGTYKTNDHTDWYAKQIAQSLLNSGDFEAQRAELEGIINDQRFFDTNKYNSFLRQRLTNVLQKAGYDALQYENDVEGDREVQSEYTYYDPDRDFKEAYILWDPSKLKSGDLITYDENGNIIPLSERFNNAAAEFRYSIQGKEVTPQEAQQTFTEQDTQYNDWAPEFYSKMQRTIEDWTGGNGKPMGAKLAANQVVNWLKGKGVKSEEIKWSGIIPYLEGKKAVTRDELLAVMAENEIRIETKVLGGPQSPGYEFWSDRDFETIRVDSPEEVLDAARWIAEDEGYDPDLVDIRPGYDGYVYAVRSDTGEIIISARPETEGDTHWSEYKTDDANGYNYREILFKMPELNYTNRAMQVHWGDQEEYEGGPDSRNIIAHARVQDMLTGEKDRNSANGVPTIFIEEIQSDLHNAGVMKPGPKNTRGLTKEHAPAGFSTTQAQREYADMSEILDHRDFTEEEEQRYEELLAQLDTTAVKEAQANYLDAIEKRKPYEAMAEEITSAIEENSMVQELKHFFGRLRHGDIVEWVTGMTRKKDSFDPNAPADQVLAQLREEDRQDATARLLEQSVPEDMRDKLEEVRAAYRAVADASEDLVVANQNLSKAPPDVPFAGSADTYHEYVMKHMIRLAAEGGYDRVAWTPAYMQSERWSDEFKEGYEIEYDQKIPKFMNKYVKQWGSKVGQIELDNGNTVYSVDITPEMKQDVLYSGQPLFSIQNPERDPGERLREDLLEQVQNGDADSIAEWVTSQLNKHEDKLEQSKIRPPAIPSKGFVPPVSAQERAAQDRANERAAKKYGLMPKSEKPVDNTRLAKRNEQGGWLRRFLQNVATAKQTQTAQDYVKRFAFTDVHATYEVDSNERDLKKAKETIKDRGQDYAINKFVDDAAKALYPGQITETLALGQQLLIETSKAGDMAGFYDVLTSLALLSTQAGKSLQAFRMLKESGPIGELYYVKKAVDQLNDKHAKQLEAGKMSKITVNEELSNAVLTAPTEEAREKAMDDLIADIAAQVPVTLAEKWNAWRYLAMLGNARTHIRNIIGNAVFVPLRFTKNLMAAAGEFVATKTGLMEEQDRTKAISVSRELRDFAKQDALVMQRELQGSGKYNPARAILDARKVLPGVLEKISRGNGNLLEFEDWLFLSPAYSNALAAALSHSGYSVEQLQTTTEGQRALNNARKIAIEEAQKATYRDFNAAASMLNRIKRMETGKASDKFIGLLLEGVLPFTKTPINILRRGVEYSPIGIASSILEAAKGVKDGNLDMAQFIDHLSAGLSGTAVAILGYLLASLGFLRGKKDDKEEEFDKLQGYQDYSLQIGDVSATIDWAAPTALPLFTGAAVHQLMQGDDLEWSDAWDAMMMIAEPMMSLSMLEGLNNAISSASYADDRQKLATVASSALTSYLGQAFPTLLGQLARSIDGTRRTTYIDKNSKAPSAIQRFVQSSVQAKIPGWESQKVPYIDAWGREDTAGSKLLGGLENFFSPSYVNVVKTTDVDDELKKLYDATKEASVLPSLAAKYFSVGGERKDLTADEYVSYAKDVGSTKYTLLTQLLFDPRYMRLSDTDKAKAVKKIYDYATATGKYHIDKNYDLHGQGVWMEEAEAMRTEAQRFNRIWEYLEEYLSK